MAFKLASTTLPQSEVKVHVLALSQPQPSMHMLIRKSTWHVLALSRPQLSMHMLIRKSTRTSFYEPVALSPENHILRWHVLALSQPQLAMHTLIRKSTWTSFYEPVALFTRKPYSATPLGSTVFLLADHIPKQQEQPQRIVAHGLLSHLQSQGSYLVVHKQSITYNALADSSPLQCLTQSAASAQAGQPPILSHLALEMVGNTAHAAWIPI